MAKRYVACPFCWGKIKDSAVKCMHCKRWLNTEENPNYKIEEKEEPIEYAPKVENRVVRNDNEVWYTNDKAILWWIIWFQIVCILWALISYISSK